MIAEYRRSDNDGAVGARPDASLEQMPDILESRIAELQSLLSPPAAVGSRTKPRFRALAQDFVAPQTDLERAITGVWQGLFGLDRMSIEENFFDLGGHSLLLVQMHDQLCEAFIRSFRS